MTSLLFRMVEKDGAIYSLDNIRLLAASDTGVPSKVFPIQRSYKEVSDEKK